MKIILDAMGGDNGTLAMVEGAVLAVAEYGCDIALVGDRDKINAILNHRGAGHITIVHASDEIDMEDKASLAVRQKKDSSMSIALKMLKDGDGDALISAGSTGALLTGATLVAKRIKGIRRAALAPVLPTKSGGALLIDCGANIDCTPEYLLQFAYMGYFYMQKLMGVKNPRVGLVNNGAEETKGGELQRESYKLLKAAGEQGRINFIGNIEGRDVMQGVCDVVVCDGFTGNVLLKTTEGTAMFLMSQIKKVFLSSLKGKIAALMVKSAMGELKKMMDYKEIGGAPMLGIAKPVIKAHGSSDGRAIKSAINQAIKFANSGFIEAVTENISFMTVEKEKSINNDEK